MITSGKGALVLEALGLVSAGTFDQDSTIFAGGYTGAVAGCGIINELAFV